DLKLSVVMWPDGDTFWANTRFFTDYLFSFDGRVMSSGSGQGRRQMPRRQLRRAAINAPSARKIDSRAFHPAKDSPRKRQGASSQRMTRTVLSCSRTPPEP